MGIAHVGSTISLSEIHMFFRYHFNPSNKFQLGLWRHGPPSTIDIHVISSAMIARPPWIGRYTFGFTARWSVVVVQRTVHLHWAKNFLRFSACFCDPNTHLATILTFNTFTHVSFFANYLPNTDPSTFMLPSPIYDFPQHLLLCHRALSAVCESV